MILDLEEWEYERNDMESVMNQQKVNGRECNGTKEYMKNEMSIMGI